MSSFKASPVAGSASLHLMYKTNKGSFQYSEGVGLKALQFQHAYVLSLWLCLLSLFLINYKYFSVERISL